MDAKISSSTWNDPDFEEFTPEMMLTLHWMKTNRERNDCGAYRFSVRRFEFETKGLDPEWHEKTRLALGETMLNEGDWFLWLPFIRECLQLGDIIGKNGRVNNGALALAKPLPSPYQALQPRKPLPSPSTMPSQFNINNLWNQVPMLMRPLSEGLTKGLWSPW